MSLCGRCPIPRTTNQRSKSPISPKLPTKARMKEFVELSEHDCEKSPTSIPRGKNPRSTTPPLRARDIIPKPTNQRSKTPPVRTRPTTDEQFSTSVGSQGSATSPFKKKQDKKQEVILYEQLIKNMELKEVKQTGVNLQHVQKSLRGDLDIVKAAVEQDWRALKFALEPAKSNKEIVLEAVKQNWRAFECVTGTLRSDPDVVEAVVKQDWRALKFALEPAKSNKEIVLQAVKQNWRAFECVTGTLRSDPDVVKAAVENDWRALIFALEPAKSNKEIVLQAVNQNWRAFEYVPESLRSEPAIRKCFFIDYFCRETSSFDKPSESKMTDLNEDSFKKIVSNNPMVLNGEGSVNFLNQSLCFLDGVKSQNPIFTIAWLQIMQEKMRLEEEQEEVFDEFINMCLTISSKFEKSLVLTSDYLVQKLWTDSSQQCIFSPYLYSHFLYVHVSKSSSDHVEFTIGNTGAGLQVDEDQKAFLLQGYTVEKDSQKSDQDFKQEIQKMIKELQEAGDSKKLNGKAFMNKTLAAVFDSIQAEQLGEKRKAQTIGNCTIKALIKGLLWQVCVKYKREDLYYQINQEMCRVLLEFFNLYPECEAVSNIIQAKQVKLQSKLDKYKKQHLCINAVF